MDGDGRDEMFVRRSSTFDLDADCSPAANHAPHWVHFRKDGDSPFTAQGDSETGPERSVGLVCGLRNDNGRQFGTWFQNLYVADLTGDGYPEVMRQLLGPDAWYDLCATWIPFPFPGRCLSDRQNLSWVSASTSTACFSPTGNCSISTSYRLPTPA